MSMLLSRIAFGSTCSNLSSRIWRCISQRRRASCADAGAARLKMHATTVRVFIVLAFTNGYTTSGVFEDDRRLSMYTRFTSLWTAVALVAPLAAAAQSADTGNGSSINYDTARHERRLTATQAQGRIELD